MAAVNRKPAAGGEAEGGAAGRVLTWQDDEVYHMCWKYGEYAVGPLQAVLEKNDLRISHRVVYPTKPLNEYPENIHRALDSLEERREAAAHRRHGPDALFSRRRESRGKWPSKFKEICFFLDAADVPCPSDWQQQVEQAAADAASAAAAAAASGAAGGGSTRASRGFRMSKRAVKVSSRAAVRATQSSARAGLRGRWSIPKSSTVAPGSSRSPAARSSVGAAPVASRSPATRSSAHAAPASRSAATTSAARAAAGRGGGVSVPKASDAPLYGPPATPSVACAASGVSVRGRKRQAGGAEEGLSGGTRRRRGEGAERQEKGGTAGGRYRDDSGARARSEVANNEDEVLVSNSRAVSGARGRVQPRGARGEGDEGQKATGNNKQWRDRKATVKASTHRGHDEEGIRMWVGAHGAVGSRGPRGSGGRGDGGGAGGAEEEEEEGKRGTGDNARGHVGHVGTSAAGGAARGAPGGTPGRVDLGEVDVDLSGLKYSLGQTETRVRVAAQRVVTATKKKLQEIEGRIVEADRGMVEESRGIIRKYWFILKEALRKEEEEERRLLAEVAERKEAELARIAKSLWE